ncbi:hypothetical protein ACIQFP_10490 [Nocardiopsis alba]|uniref:hypothetical protein n=1 Tax=Nocardiopsis alba TaxID=53437 RepID=UPI003813317E
MSDIDQVRAERDRAIEEAEAVRALARRYRDRWNEALEDGERWRYEAGFIRARADRWRDRCKARTTERDEARRDAQTARNELGAALRERDEAYGIIERELPGWLVGD